MEWINSCVLSGVRLKSYQDELRTGKALLSLAMRGMK